MQVELNNMDSIRKKFSKDVFDLLNIIAKQISNDDFNSIFLVLNISSDNARAIIDKIIIGLPDRYFHGLDQAQLNKRTEIIVNDFILFQVQETIDNVDYTTNLTNFIENISFKMDKQFE